MSEVATVKLNNNLTLEEDRIRIVIESNLNATLAETFDNFQKALDDVLYKVNMRFETQTLQQREIDRIVTERLAVLERQTANAPIVPFMPGIDKVMNRKISEVLRGSARPVRVLGNRATPLNRQQSLYKAGDAVAALLNMPGAPKAHIHFDRTRAMSYGAAAVVAGVAVGIGGAVAVSRYKLKKAGKSYGEFKAWRDSTSAQSESADE